MKKERIKSVILLLLIANCIQLTGQIWLDKKLWPSGYNFFNSMANLPVISDIVDFLKLGKGQEPQLYTIVTQPRKIIINGGGAREVYYDNNKQYSDALLFTKKIVEGMFRNPPRATTITTEQWQSLFKGKSIYVDFGFNVDTNNLVRIYNVSPNSNFTQFTSTSGIIIAPGSVTNEVSICVKDSKTDGIIKYTVDFKGDDLIKYIESLTIGKQQGHAFAFELNLDKRPDKIDIKRKVVLDPLVLLPMNISKRNKLDFKNPFEAIDNLSAVADRIVTSFDYNPSSLRKSVAQDGIASYVENSATVKVYPSGLIEYNAITADKGIKLGGNTVNVSQAVNGVIDVAKKVWKSADVSSNLDVRLLSDLEDNKTNDYTVNMNYSMDGMPVIIDPNHATEAITAEVQDGYIKSFKMMIITFSQTSESVEGTPVLSAIDQLFVKYQQAPGETKIDDIFECYSPIDKNVALLQWCVRLDDENGSVVVP